MSLNEQQIAALAEALGLVLDQLESDRGSEVLRAAVKGIGVVLAANGGLGLMSRVMDIVLDQKPEQETWREGMIDARWSGVGGWMS